jgi:ATP-dependent Lon protease
MSDKDNDDKTKPRSKKSRGKKSQEKKITSVKDKNVKTKRKAFDALKKNTRTKSKPKPKPKAKRAKKRFLISSDTEEEEEEEESDVDEHGNIKGLIDYDMTDDEFPVAVRRSNRLASKRIGSRNKRQLVKRKKTPLRETEFIEIDVLPSPQHPMALDDTFGKMLMLSQLCNQVERLGKKRRPKRKRKKSFDENETSDSSDDDDDSDSTWNELDEDLDLRESLTPVEEKYFKKLSKKNKRELDEEYESLRLLNITTVPLKFRILNLKHVSVSSKGFLMNRLNTFQTMEPTENEYHKLHAWFSNFEKLPLDKFKNFGVSKDKNSTKEIYNFLAKSRKTLDTAVYGHEHVKDEIVQLLSSWISNSEGHGQVLALRGPPGNGKTTLVKNGLSKVIDRPFALIALGGAKDSAFLQGHDYTFEGSKPGRIVEVLRDSECMNPVIFFDEVDKLSETAAGKEISNLLCHLLDPVQNSLFHDRYFSGIDLDLSKAIFVMSFNDIEKVDPILRDRMNVVNMKGFSRSDKIKIANNYLIPELYKEFNFNPKHLKIPDSSLRHVIDKYTKEQGVRELRRKLYAIIGKLNVLKIVGKRSESKLKKVIQCSLPAPLKFPLTLTSENIDSLLKTSEVSTALVPTMYM